MTFTDSRFSSPPHTSSGCLLESRKKRLHCEKLDRELIENIYSNVINPSHDPLDEMIVVGIKESSLSVLGRRKVFQDQMQQVGSKHKVTK